MILAMFRDGHSVLVNVKRVWFDVLGSRETIIPH